MDNVIGSGILPLAIHNKQIYMLLGRERNEDKSNGTWCGFGGGREPNESVVDNAVREFMEESMATIMSREDIIDILKNNKDGRLLTRYQLEKDNSEHRYIEHIVLIEYNSDLPNLFDRIHKEFYHCAKVIDMSCGTGQCNITGVDIGKTCSPLFEKDRIAWYNFDKVIELAYYQRFGKSGINDTYGKDTNPTLRPCFVDMTLAAEGLIRKSVSSFLN